MSKKFEEKYVETVTSKTQHVEKDILDRYNAVCNDFQNITTEDKKVLELCNIFIDENTELSTILETIKNQWSTYDTVKQLAIVKIFANGDYQTLSEIISYLNSDSKEDSDTDPTVDQEELCQYIKDQLGEESNLTLEDIDTVLNLEMDYLRSKGIVAD